MTISTSDGQNSRVTFQKTHTSISHVLGRSHYLWRGVGGGGNSLLAMNLLMTIESLSTSTFVVYNIRINKGIRK